MDLLVDERDLPKSNYEWSGETLQTHEDHSIMSICIFSSSTKSFIYLQITKVNGHLTALSTTATDLLFTKHILQNLLFTKFHVTTVHAVALPCI